MDEKFIIGEDELMALLHEASADVLDVAASHIKENATYRGSDIALWLASYANDHRREALRLHGN